ncbi:MAG: double-strand break repair protein AddB [Alphaproteobacteria bacterium]|nr:double-strand break repair protein AddB [Alphaproteobacteria bacterium]
MSDKGVAQRNVLSLPPGVPFARALAQHFLEETQGNPEILARYTVLLPTRRACRTVRENFLKLTAGKPILLPKLLPIGDVDESDLSLQMFGADRTFLDVAPAMPGLRRRLLLSKMLQAGAVFAEGPEQAIRLADSLSSLLDQMIIEGKEFAELASLVPEEFAAHWQVTLTFLEILSVHWPKILKESGVIDAAARRNILLRAFAEHWRKFPPEDPVIAAGTTGSIPATAELLDAVSLMPNGRVILPGLDLELDPESWDVLDETHPQYLMKKLLERLGMKKEDVRVLSSQSGFAAPERQNLVREIMRPAATTGQWAGFGKRIREGGGAEALTKGLQLYVCDMPQEEALVIALLMREALEEDGKTACLITPDRGLARRVSAHCQRWGIDVDDSAGQALPHTSVGTFLSAVLAAATRKLDPAAFLALLKHPLCGLGLMRDDLQGHVRFLERRFLRNDEERPRRIRDLAEQLSAGQYASLLTVVDRLQNILEPLAALDDRNPHSFRAFFDAHIRAAEDLATHPDVSGAARLWTGEAGEAAAAFLAELQEEDGPIGLVDYSAYGDLFRTLSSSVIVRPVYGTHPRLSILGQLEARMNDADLVILGGLNEGTWPPSQPDDPWLSAPMRQALGLPGFERAVGLAAHDFSQAFCAREVVLTRSRKVEGAPTVPARWLQKLDAVLQACGSDSKALSKGPHLRWARMMDHAQALAPVARPAPRPPVGQRPAKISVTRVQSWLEDPYGIYARYTLGLKKLSPLSVQTDHALRGKVLHKAFETFLGAYPEHLPDDAEEILFRHLEQAIDLYIHDPETLRFWVARMDGALRRMLAHEREWRRSARFYATEAKGEAVLSLDGVPFVLEGRADRIDKRADGYALIDYKSGGSFTESKLKKGEYPQLPLEALMMERGRFTLSSGAGPGTISPGPVSYLGYWMVAAGSKGESDLCVQGDLSGLTAYVEAGFMELIRVFRDEAVAYSSLPDPQRKPRFNDYEHLARVREWSVADSESTEVF